MRLRPSARSAGQDKTRDPRVPPLGRLGRMLPRPDNRRGRKAPPPFPGGTWRSRRRGADKGSNSSNNNNSSSRHGCREQRAPETTGSGSTKRARPRHEAGSASSALRASDRMGPSTRQFASAAADTSSAEDVSTATRTGGEDGVAARTAGRRRPRPTGGSGGQPDGGLRSRRPPTRRSLVGGVGEVGGDAGEARGDPATGVGGGGGRGFREVGVRGRAAGEEATDEATTETERRRGGGEREREGEKEFRSTRGVFAGFHPPSTVAIFPLPAMCPSRLPFPSRTERSRLRDTRQGPAEGPAAGPGRASSSPREGLRSPSR